MVMVVRFEPLTALAGVLGGLIGGVIAAAFGWHALWVRARVRK